MEITVKLFAGARLLAECEEITVCVPPPHTVAELRAALEKASPPLQSLLPAAVFAINAEYVRDDAPLGEDQTVALIPPVSGG